ncbi:MAG: PorT family protein [Bacteroidales bacterium]|nr:PorT family protein [Bacteroidales bacterium]
MKKLLILLTVLVVAGSAEAKIRVGLKGGLNFASFPKSNVYVFDNRTGWHIGGMMNIGLPLFGLAVQPEFMYSSKGADGASSGYVEIPVDLQWGFKLPLLRPYLSLTPYMSYAVNSNMPMTDINKWDGGIGVGAGIDIWKLQLSIKYFWGFGKVTDLLGSPSPQNRNLMLSLGIFL